MTVRPKSPTSRGLGPEQALQQPPGPSGVQVEDSTGLNFDFKDKLDDSSASTPNIEDYYRRQNGSSNHLGTVTSHLVEVPMREPLKATALFDAPGDLRGPRVESASKVRLAASPEQIEFGDVSDKQAQLIQQNRELKDLVIKLQNQIGHLQADKIRFEKELNNIMDPLSASSQLKEVAAG